MMRDSRGNVSLEFVAIGVFMLIPICYIAVSALTVAHTFMTLTGAARTGVRTFVIQNSDAQAKSRAAQVIKSQLKLGQIDSRQVKIEFLCSQDPCLTPRSFITATLKKKQSVGIPLLKPISISLAASQTIEVDSIR